MKLLRFGICALAVFAVAAHGGVEDWARAVFETAAGLLRWERGADGKGKTLRASRPWLFSATTRGTVGRSLGAFLTAGKAAGAISKSPLWNLTTIASWRFRGFMT